MVTLALQLLIFSINLLRDYIILLQNPTALNYLIISIAVMGFVSSGLLDIVMVRSINFGGFQNYAIVICATFLVAILSGNKNTNIQYAYYISCSLLNIIAFSNSMKSASILLRRQVALIQSGIIFLAIFFLDNYQLTLPCFFFVSTIAPLLFNLIKNHEGELFSETAQQRSEFNRWIILKICLASLLSIFIIWIANANQNMEVSLALRILSYLVTAANIFIPMILVGELFGIIMRRALLVIVFLLVSMIIIALYVHREIFVLYIAMFGCCYLLAYGFLCKKILVQDGCPASK